MADTFIDKIREFLSTRQGREVDLNYIRNEMKIDPNSPAWTSLGKIMAEDLTNKRIVKPSGKRDGVYRVIVQVAPVQVFGIPRDRLPPFTLIFPKDFDTGMEMSFANDVVIREGDLILISGMSNFGKTTLCLNFCGENIDKNPVLMGNEYTTLVDGNYTPTPRFLIRLDAMDWVNWRDADGFDKFTLLPVRDDYAEHIVKDRINIIDWINIETGEHYMIGTIMEGIKKQLGRGIAIIAIQKGEGTTAGRGGQFTKDFADLEILIDKFGDSDVLLTIGKVKEYTNSVIGKTYSYGINKGVKIINFREVQRCPSCKGQGYTKGEKCSMCWGNKFVDK